MELVGNTFFFPWEVNLMEWLQSHLSPGLISLISQFSLFGEELFLILMLGFLYWSYDKKMARTLGLNILAVQILFPMIKNVALRRRPYFDHEGIKILRVVEPAADPLDIAAQGYSFPSGHSASVMSAFAGLAAYKKKWYFTLLAVVLPLLVGFSRVVVGAHYPTDVLAGWLVGLAAVAAVPRLQKAVKNRLAFYGILLAVSLPGFFFCKSADFFTGFGLLLGFIVSCEIDDRFVRFENTRSPIRAILRVVGGLLVFLALNQGLKLPFSNEFLNGSSYPSLLVRCARYAIVSIAAFGLYPMVFRYTAKIGRKAEAAASM